MAHSYKYDLDQCAVSDRSTLKSFREKRATWHDWLEDDEHHQIWRTISDMVWLDVSFQTLSHFATRNEHSPLNNDLMFDAIANGMIARQVLAIRRLVDKGTHAISVHRLLEDISKNLSNITRENYVCYDALPYDYETVKRQEFEKLVSSGSFAWVDPNGPGGYAQSQHLHEQFDRLSGISVKNRQRTDRIPGRVITHLRAMLSSSGAYEIAKWSHNYLAHAATAEARKEVDYNSLQITKVREAIRLLARTTEAISSNLLGISSRRSALMPVAQFDQFAKLQGSVLPVGTASEAQHIWQIESRKCDAYLDGDPASFIP